MSGETIRRRARVLVGACCLVSATGCAASSTPSSPVSGAAEGSRYYYDRVGDLRQAPALDNVMEPENLRAAMPTNEFVVETDERTVEFTFSDALVVGEISEVAEGSGYTYSDNDNTEIVDFRSTAADARDLVVTVDVEDAVGAPTSEVQFRMGVLNGSDPDRFMLSLGSLKRVVVVLEKIETGLNVGEFVPVMGGALIGQVRSDGAVRFEALGDDEARFMGEIDTVDEILEAASSAPTRGKSRNASI